MLSCSWKYLPTDLLDIQHKGRFDVLNVILQSPQIVPEIPPRSIPSILCVLEHWLMAPSQRFKILDCTLSSQ